MQRYKCHKIVEAAKVAYAEGRNVTTESGEFFVLPSSMADRATGEDMGYVVRYEDGYVSWSPTKPFEDGYSPIEG